jgi:DNA gyrase subunit A
MIQKPIEHIIKDNMMNYSAYVLLDRALPDIRDGLKPVHRRILVTMLNEKAFNLTKSANISGSVMKLHPHGDSYPTIVNMVQKDKQNIPYIVGKGNFAQHTSRDMQPGASRYTEIKLSEVAKEMLSNLKKGMVRIIPNYDGTLTMPEVLPVKFPTILTHTNIGIGVGFSSSIPSFNLIELAAAMIEYINTGKKTNLVPDFATGGLISNDVEMFSQINETGLGSLKLRGKAKIVGNEIAITDIPYTTSREAIIKKIVDLSKAGKFKEILDVKDLTGLKGQLIEIRCRKNSDMQLVLDKLFKLTSLEASFSVNMNILINNLPKVV